MEKAESSRKKGREEEDGGCGKYMLTDFLEIIVCYGNKNFLF